MVEKKVTQGRGGKGGRGGRGGTRLGTTARSHHTPSASSASSASSALLGAHVSTAGGVAKAPARGMAIGATAIQIFTKTPSQWRDPVVTPETAEAFRAALEASGLRAVVAHDSYLINLASPDPVLRRRSIAAFKAELERCRTLGIPFVVSHPGNYIDDRGRGLERNAEGYAEALEAVPGVGVLLEGTAGSGTALGRTFEELAELRRLLPNELHHRVAYCLDTCHLYSSGYDLVNAFDEVWQQFDDVCGIGQLKVLHLNDSKTRFASRRDRHELIAEGSLGAAPFRRIMRESRFEHVIRLIETPKGTDEVTNDRRMLRRLRSYSRAARPLNLTRDGEPGIFPAP